MTTIFDGRAFRDEKERLLSIRVIDLFTEKDVTPKLVSIIVGEDPASIMYVNLKKKAGERIGAEVDIIVLPEEATKKAVITTIESFNKLPDVNGIMIQLPLPKNFSKEDRNEIINSIDPNKDVDGLRVDSKFTPPTAKAVLEIFKEALKVVPVKVQSYKVAVVGASGFIGQQIVRALKKENIELGIKELELAEANSKTQNLQLITYNSDVVIGVVGKDGLIKADMIKDGAILIDVGAPNGDIEMAAYEKASFVSPVPGGVGPVTISCLLENLVLAAEN